MILRIRRFAAAVGAVALATGASIALSAAPGGASPQPAAASTTVGINGVCGGVLIGTMPANLGQGHSESQSLRLFRERLDYTLIGSVPVDFVATGLYDQPADLPSPKPLVAGGTRVNSYILHSDPIGQNALMRQHRAATFGFTTDVLGVQVLSATLTETQADQLHTPGTHYPNATSGLELAPSGGGDFARIINRRTVSISFKTSTAVDEIRVITKATVSEASALKGYRILAADGGVFDFGGQQFYGSTGGTVLNQPVVAGVNTCSNAGYWFVARDGGVFSYGDAVFHGSLGGVVISSPVVGMTVTPTGFGYYLVRADGTVSIFGDARFFRDASGLALNQPVVGMTTTPTGLGYYLVASDGGIFTYGDGVFYGSTGSLSLVSPIIGMTTTRTGLGYYLYAADGGIFSFGDAKFFGSVGGAVRTHPIVGMRLSPSGLGYWLTDSAGKVYAFGDAVFAGDMSAVPLFRPMIGMM
jgi:hypothetical protein